MLSPERVLLFLASVLTACGSEGEPAPAGNPDPGAGKLTGLCPAGFSPRASENRGLSSDGVDRVFHVVAPGDVATPRPLFVSLTGTVQPELDFAAQSALDQLPSSGWIVAAPVRNCSQNGTNCAQGGSDGRVWEPWYDGTIPA